MSFHNYARKSVLALAALTIGLVNANAISVGKHFWSDYPVCNSFSDESIDKCDARRNLSIVLAAPVAVNDSFIVNEETLLLGYVGLNDSDDDSDSTQWSFQLTNGGTTSSNGNFMFNSDGTFSFLPQVEFSGTVFFEYTLCDASGPPSCDTGTVFIRVDAVNDPPSAVGETVVGDEDIPELIQVLSNDNDPDGDLDTNSLAIISGPQNGTVLLNADGTLTYTPDPDYAGNDTIYYRICDDGIPPPALCDSAQVVIVILPVNDAPVAQNDAFSTDEDVFFTDDLAVNDSDVDHPNTQLLYSIVDSASAGANGQILINNNGVFTYIPNFGFNGVVGFSYQVCDPGPLCDTAFVSIAVGSVNDPPVATDDTASTLEETAVTIDVLNNDVDPDGQLDTSSVALFGGVANGTAVVNSDGSITYTPDLNYNGVTVFSYVVCDSAPPALCDTANITVTVSPVNDPPVAAGDGFNMDEDDSLVGADLGTNDSDVDDSNIDLTWSLIPGSDAAANGALTVNADGTFDYVPDPNFNGAVAFEYELCDDGIPALCDTATANIFIAPVQDPIIANDDFENMTPGLVILIANVIANDFDSLDGGGGVDPTSLTIITSSTNGTDTAYSNGTIQYTPDSGFVGLDSIQYVICDLGNPLPPTCDTAWMFIDVMNMGPLAFDDFLFMLEDDSIVFDPLVNDSTVNTQFDTTSLSVISPPTNGTIQNVGDGTFIYTPDPNFNGSDVFTYSICDTSGFCSVASVSITVGPVNDPPVLINDQFTTVEDTPVNMDVLANDSDPIDPLGNMDTTSVAVIAGPSNGVAVVVSNGTIDYTPNPNFTGSDTLLYVACDDGNSPPGLCDTAQVVILVTPVNDAPVITDATGMPVDTLFFTTMEDSSGLFCVIAVDAEGDTIDLVSAFNGPLNGVVTGVGDGDTCLVYTPASNYFGSDTMTMVVCDPFAACDTVLAIMDIVPVNDAPVALNDTVTTSEDIAVVIPVLPNDSDPNDPNGGLDTTSVAVVSGPGSGSLIINPDGSFTYTPDPDFFGPDIFSYVVCDNGIPAPAICDTADVLITVLPVNDDPVIVDAMNQAIDTLFVSTITDLAVEICPSAIDVDGDSLQVSQVFNGPANGVVSNVANGDTCFTYTPDPGYGGGDTLQVVVCDPFGGCDTAVVVMNVVMNAPPIIVDTVGTPVDTLFVTTVEDALVIICPDVIDPDLDEVDVVSIFGGPANGLISGLANGDTCLTYTPVGNYDGLDTFNIVVCDTMGLCDSALVIVTIAGQNDFPFITDDSVSTFEDVSTIIDVLANDFDTSDATGGIDTTTVQVVGGPNNGVATVNSDGTISYTPDPNFNGIDTLLYVVCDNGEPVALPICDTAQVIITVIPVNDPPVIVDVLGNPTDTVFGGGLSGTPILICLDAIDVDGDTLDLTSILNGPSNGLATGVADGDTCFVYTSDPGFFGTDTLSAVVCDGSLACDTVLVILNIFLNDPPFAVDDTILVNTGATTTIDNLANDSDPNGDPITTTAVTANNGSAVINAGGTIDYTPDPGFCGVDTLQYVVCDTLNACDSALIFVDVNCAPIAVNDTVSTDQDVTVNVVVLTNDSDPDGDPITVSAASAINGTAAIQPNGSITYTPDPGYCGPDVITYVICDIHGLCDTGQVIIDVICTNDPPVAVDDSTMMEAGMDVDIDVLANDFDPNGDPLTVTSASAQHGTVMIGPGGSLSYTPDPGYCGPDTIDYVICDLEPLCDSGQVFLTIDCPEEVLAIPQGFSPNGDAFGQAWVIAGLQDYPNTAVQIFNRWGNVVYTANPYTNDWEGESNQGEAFGSELPVGTYFYIIELNDEAGTVYSGYVYLNR